MDKLRNAAVLALESLELLSKWMDIRGMVTVDNELEAITALREALAQPQETNLRRNKMTERNKCTCSDQDKCQGCSSPTQGEWVDLTDDEVDLVIDETYGESPELYVTQVRHDFSKALLAKFKEKNTPPVVPQGEPVAWANKDGIKNWSKDFSAYQTQLYTIPVYTTPPSVEAMRIETLEKAANVLSALYEQLSEDREPMDHYHDGKMVGVDLSEQAIRSMK